MVDHVKVGVTDLEKAKAYYTEALAPLGYSVHFEADGMVYFADAAALDFGVGATDSPGGAHVGVRGTRCGHGARVLRRRARRGRRRQRRSWASSQYGEGYYAAYVLDPDGNNIEAKCHEVS